MATAIFVGLLAVAEAIGNSGTTEKVDLPTPGFYAIIFCGVMIYDIISMGAL